MSAINAAIDYITAVVVIYARTKHHHECVVELVLWFHRLIPVKQQSTDVILHLARGVSSLLISVDRRSRSHF